MEITSRRWWLAPVTAVAAPVSAVLATVVPAGEGASHQAAGPANHPQRPTACAPAHFTKAERTAE